MALTNQTNRLLLRIVAGAMFLASAIVLWRAFCSPALPTISSDDIASATPRLVATSHLTRDLEELAPMLDRSLGSALYDPPPRKQPEEKAKVTKQETPRPKKVREAAGGLRVVGTMIEEGRSLAILMDASGGIQLRGVGEAVETPTGEGQVESIELRQVTIALEDETLTLPAPQ